MPETSAPVKGHAYRPQRAAFDKRTVPGCECGEVLGFGHPMRAETARRIHREHKADVEIRRHDDGM